MPTETLILNARSLAPARAVPLGLEGRPTELYGRKVEYFRKEVAKAGDWTHRGTGEPFSITPQRMDDWVVNTRALLSAGVVPYVPNRHRFDVANGTPDDEQQAIETRKNYGRVLDVRRDGESLVADLMLVGDEAIDAIAANDVSICIVDGMRDARGGVHGEALQHLAVVPNPNQPDLGPFVRIAASGDLPEVDAKVYEPGAAATVAAAVAPSAPTLALASAAAGFPVRSRLGAVLALCGDEPCDACDGGSDAPADDDYEPDEAELPDDFERDGHAPKPRSRLSLALAGCGANGPGGGGFQKGNTCGGEGHGARNGLRTSRVTLANIKAAGAKQTREYTDASGRKVTEYRTDDGRLFHAVSNGRGGGRNYHQVHGERKAKPAKAKAAPVEQKPDAAKDPARAKAWRDHVRHATTQELRDYALGGAGFGLSPEHRPYAIAAAKAEQAARAAGTSSHPAEGLLVRPVSPEEARPGFTHEITDAKGGGRFGRFGSQALAEVGLKARQRSTAVPAHATERGVRQLLEGKGVMSRTDARRSGHEGILRDGGYVVDPAPDGGVLVSHRSGRDNHYDATAAEAGLRRYADVLKRAGYTVDRVPGTATLHVRGPQDRPTRQWVPPKPLRSRLAVALSAA